MDDTDTNPGNSRTSSKSSDEKKRIRNRLSQRAFRRRQAENMRALRDRANPSNKPADERIMELEEENQALRMQLIEVQSKLTRISITAQTLNETVSNTLGQQQTSPTRPEQANENVTTPPATDHGAVQDANRDIPAGENDLLSSSFDFLTLPEYDSAQPPPMRPATDVFSNAIPPDVLLHAESLGGPQLSNIWTYEYQMGPESYADALDAIEASSLMSGKGWTESNSPFSDHIDVLQRLLKVGLRAKNLSSDRLLSSLYHSVVMVLSMFNSITRPEVMAWYASTRFYHIIELTAWQLYPCVETFRTLHQRYRPTKLQMEHQHPKVIDWIPFSSIRDGLIRMHAANPHIDQIFCDAVSSYAVEVPMSELIIGAPSITAYVRVTDLSTRMSALSAEEDTPTEFLPVLDAATLFSTPEYARAAFKKLKMDQGVCYYKMDPTFFGKYPELYDPTSVDIIANGIPLRPDLQPSLTLPSPLDDSTFRIYRSFIAFSMDASSMVSPLERDSTCVQTERGLRMAVGVSVEPCTKLQVFI